MSDIHRSLSPSYDPISSMAFDANRCFLCGGLLTAADVRSESTREHVIPRWMQRRFGLYDQELSLQNGSAFKYRKLTIPCCKTCNTLLKKAIEDPISKAQAVGYTDFVKLPKKTIAQWAAKIFYGILYKETTLKQDIRDASGGPILPAVEMQRYRMLHLFLQSARFGMDFIPGLPHSVFVFNTIQVAQIGQFDLLDNIPNFTMGVRMGDVGVIVCLTDGGSQKWAFEEEYERLKDHRLHPIQFIEVFCMLTYKLHTLQEWPNWAIKPPRLRHYRDRFIIYVEDPGGGYRYGNWDSLEYSQLLHHHLSVRKVPSRRTGADVVAFEDIYESDHAVWTWLRQPDGSVPDLTWTEEEDSA